MGKVLWFTGLSGSGKSTISDVLQKELEKLGLRIRTFDGDVVRRELHKHLGFTPEDIIENNRLITLLCQENISKYDFILVPIISPFNSSRENARKVLEKDFIEVFVNCSYEECKNRDVKGLYKKARAGQIGEFTGISSPYEKPEKPEMIVNTGVASLDDCVCQVLTEMELRGYIKVANQA